MVLVLESLELCAKAIILILESLHSGINLLLNSLLNCARLFVRIAHKFALKHLKVGSILLLERSEVIPHRADFNLHQLELFQDGCSIKVTRRRAHVHIFKSLKTALVIIQKVVRLVGTGL